MVTDCSPAFYFFDALVPFLMGTANPLRPYLIAAVAMLWLFCFGTLFRRDRRKAKLRYLEKRRQGPEFAEKRKHGRIVYPMPVRYRIIGPQEIAGAVHVSNARDLSEDGMLLEVKEDLPIGARLELKLPISSTGRSILVTGTVLRKEWLESIGVFAVGVLFEALQPKERDDLSGFIEQERKREEIA